ncbi:MAG: hypothetical protein KDI19_04555 [Pseudomonadales bacterium]|nr:hypothetical protein [Pseudomonadales bacterium]
MNEPHTYRSRRHQLAARLQQAVLLFILIMSGQAAVAKNGTHCGQGEAQSTLQALPVGYVHATDFASRDRHAGVGGGTLHCQFRVFADGATYVFHQGDVVVGGIVYLFDYRNWGLTHAEAIADTEAFEDTVWFGPTGGAMTVQPLERTAYKQMHRPDWGLTLYQQRAFIMRFTTPGEYTSHWESTYYGEPSGSATVHIVVLPSE